MASEPDTLFRSDEIVNMELRADFTAIKNDRGENPQYHDGELIYHTSDGKAVKFLVKVMTRGFFRRNPQNCNFPPLTVNFKKNEVGNTLFENQDKLKLVTPCQFDRDVIEEYLIYKMYNQVTEWSFKVRLVKMLYFDTGRDKKIFERYSFFIEHEDQVGERTNSVETDKFISPFGLNRETFNKMAVFQYMIGNKDWFISSRKNVVIMQPKDSTLVPYAVPYDFDFAALVNADYTKPKDVSPELLETRRVFKGICLTVTELNNVFASYKSLKPVFVSIIENMQLLPKSSRQENIAYLNSFYEIIESSNLIKQEFIDRCETRKDYNLKDE